MFSYLFFGNGRFFFDSYMVTNNFMTYSTCENFHEHIFMFDIFEVRLYNTSLIFFLHEPLL